MKNKLIVSSIAIATAAAAFAGGTYAAFTDEEVTPTQSFSAGTLDIKFTDTTLSNSAIGIPFDLTNLKPGDTEPTRYIHVVNDGTLPGRVSVYLKKISDEEGPVPEPEEVVEPDAAANGGELDSNMRLNIDGFVNGGQTLGTLAVGAEALVNGKDQSGADSIFELREKGAKASDGKPLDEKWLSVDWEIPASVGNNIMGDSTKFQIIFRAEQIG